MEAITPPLPGAEKVSEERMPSPQDWLIVDVRGLKCPLPVLKTQKRMAPLPQGTLVAVLASDPMARIDIPHFCNEHGHSLIAQSEEEGFVRYEIRKGGGRPG